MRTFHKRRRWIRKIRTLAWRVLAWVRKIRVLAWPVLAFLFIVGYILQETGPSISEKNRPGYLLKKARAGARRTWAFLRKLLA
jgi:hypothetical protein